MSGSRQVLNLGKVGKGKVGGASGLSLIAGDAQLHHGGQEVHILRRWAGIYSAHPIVGAESCYSAECCLLCSRRCTAPGCYLV